MLYKERLRLGTIELIKRLQEDQIEVWIYTTSFRTQEYITDLFKRYGIILQGIVNGQRHHKEVQGTKKEPMPSKYPARYRIDLHIDDDISVAQNGKLYGFNVFIVEYDHKEWVKEILEQVNKIKKGNRNKG